MVSPAELHRANRDPIVTPELLLLEFWEQGNEASKQYAVIDNKDIVSNGQTYHKAGISVSLPGSQLGQNISISVSNVDRSIGRTVLSTKQPIICRMMEINAAQPDVVLKDTHDLFMLSGVSVTTEQVSGDLIIRWSDQEPFPNEGVSDLFYPGL